MIGSLPGALGAGTAGQGPRLIFGLRRPVMIDQSALTRLTEVSREPEAILPGGFPVRSPDDVSRGLGLSIAAEQALGEAVRDWVTAPDPITFRRHLLTGLRGMAPRDLQLRSEIARRCVELYRSSAPPRPDRWGGRVDRVMVQKSTEGELLTWDIPGAYAGPSLRAERLALRLRSEPVPPELVWMVAEGDDLEAREAIGEELVGKAAGHKYLKRVPTGKPRPRWRYFYRLPSKGRLTSSEDLATGAKFKVKHEGKEGHFEVLAHDKKRGIVHVKHDESGREAHVHERDLHRMVQSYHRQATAEKAPEGKAQAAPLARISMADLARGEYDNIEGFSPDAAELEAQAAAMGGDREWAVMKQPNGFCLVSKRKREAGRQREVKGEETSVKLRSADGKGIDNVQAEYVLMDASDLIASHKPEALGHFPQNPAYPENVQERRYHAITAEQEKVDRIAKNLDPAIMINTNPDAVNGPPIITQDRVVLGGNGRAMAIQRSYREYPDSAEKLRSYLVANARKYGVSAADVRAMKQPMIVRRMTVKDPGEKNAKLKLLGRRMNEALTQGLDPRSEEVAVAQFVTSHVTDALVGAIEPDQTLSEFLYSKASEDFVRSLRQAGIIDDYNKAQYIENGGRGTLLNEDGRRRVERVMAARLVPDADILERMNPTLRESLALSTPSLVVAEQHGWPIAESLKLAVEADLHIRATSDKGAKVAHREFLQQTEIGSSGLDLSKRIHADPVAKALLTIIREHVGTTKMPAAFRGFALRSVQDHEDHAFSEGARGGVGVLAGFGRTRVTPAEALDIEFGMSPARAAEKRERETAAKEAARAEKDAERERKRLDKLQAEADRDQGALFAASDRSRPTLIKAVGGNALLNRAIHHARWLVQAEVHRATLAGRAPAVRLDQVVRRVLDDAQQAALADPQLAAGLAAVNEKSVRGIVKALVAMTAGEVRQ
ncbi:MAG: hypothetical protein MUC88_00155 [Planctomycetes bacterium]|jgi:hypothetical protein|nr:hypothetical protein [Planctomycetota bacterium]